MPRAALPLTLLLLALVAAPAQGGIKTWGSSLKASPTKALAIGSDTAYWQTDLPGTRAVRSPSTGQVLDVRVKGIAVPSGKGEPDTRVFFQVLRPRSNGSFRIIVSSGPFNMPVGGDPNRISTFRPENMCIRKGDRLAFNTVGGFAPDLGYPNGTPFQIFATTAGSKFARDNAPGKTNNGDVLSGGNRKGELLMRARVGTKQDGTGLCAGGTRIG